MMSFHVPFISVTFSPSKIEKKCAVRFLFPTLSASVDVAENHHFTQDLSMSAVSCPELR